MRNTGTMKIRKSENHEENPNIASLSTTDTKSPAKRFDYEIAVMVSHALPN